VTVIRIPSLRLVQGERKYRRYDRGERSAGMRAMPSASAIALGHLRDFSSSGSAGTANDLPDFVQILVESWGLPKDETLGHALLAPYADPQLRERYRGIEGAMPFEGPTTSGESRELCQTHSADNASPWLAGADAALPARPAARAGLPHSRCARFPRPVLRS
jgi:hypothetical protein